MPTTVPLGILNMLSGCLNIDCTELQGGGSYMPVFLLPSGKCLCKDWHELIPK